jgi:hypothetical protein
MILVRQVLHTTTVLEPAKAAAVVAENADADAVAAPVSAVLAVAIKGNIQINYCIWPMMPGWKS